MPQLDRITVNTATLQATAIQVQAYFQRHHRHIHCQQFENQQIPLGECPCDDSTVSTLPVLIGRIRFGSDRAPTASCNAISLLAPVHSRIHHQ
jgi:hypothetical protein